MGINDIDLPELAIANLFKSTLVQIHSKVDKPLASPDSAVASSIDHLGKNAKHILIVVNYPKETYLPKKQLEFLVSILKACALNIDDTALVNLGTLKTGYAEVIHALRPAIVLIFGKHPMLDGVVQTSDFEKHHSDGITILGVPALEVFDAGNPDSKTNKGKLWNCLKSIFFV